MSTTKHSAPGIPSDVMADALLVADVDLGEVQRSHARRVLIKDRRPDLYGDWLGG